MRKELEEFLRPRHRVGSKIGLKIRAAQARLASKVRFKTLTVMGQPGSEKGWAKGACMAALYLEAMLSSIFEPTNTHVRNHVWWRIV